MLHLRFRQPRARKFTGLLLICIVSLFPLNLPPQAAARADEVPPPIPAGAAYHQTNHVSDVPGMALIEDKLLVNPWGISLTSTSPFWVANTGTSTSTLYRGDVAGSPLVPNPGLPSINIPGGLPTGTVANTTNSFVVVSGATSGPARFLFASITGNIVGWNPNVPAPGSRQGVVVAHVDGAVYTGLAIGKSGIYDFLYAANFAQRRIDVFASTFGLVALPGNFTDPGIPGDYAPFNIQALGGKLYVAYAKVDPLTGMSTPGAGNGYVSTFDFDGNFLGRVVSNGPLSAPWGMAIAPAGFGTFSNALLVGNFGEDGHINAFNAATGAHLGTMINESGSPVEIDFLWALTFGNGGNGGDPNALYFSAGIGEEKHGLFGSLRPTAAAVEASSVQFAASDFSINETNGSIQVTVTRSGDVSGTATVNYATFDLPDDSSANQKSDYQIALGSLTFAPTETSKTFPIFIVNDTHVEQPERIHIALSNPTGAGLGIQDEAEVEIISDDPVTVQPISNPLNNPDAQFFVRQHYLDFLNREPDAAGLAFWTGQITSCGNDAGCREVRRINVSAAFFLSVEFQQTGFLVYRAHKAAFGTLPRYGPFMRDTHAIGKGVVVGQGNWEAQLEANKQAFFNDFVTRPEFLARYPSTMTNEQYVDALLGSAGLTPAQVRLFVVNMTNAQENPPANPTSSNGGARPASFGTARLRFNEAQTAMTLNATVNNMDFTGTQTPTEANDNLTNAHIHASATVTPTTNAPVVWGFIGTPFNDNNPNDSVVRPFTTGVGGTVSAKWDAPEGNNTTLAAQLSNLREGRAYVNFHSTQFPGGEIRGNIPAATAFRDSLIAGLNGGTETRATVLRRVAEAEELGEREFNAAFVLMQYFGYLRRNPDDPPDADMSGYNFWLNKLNQFNGDFIRAEMVKAFLNSGEYRTRFGLNN